MELMMFQKERYTVKQVANKVYLKDEWLFVKWHHTLSIHAIQLTDMNGAGLIQSVKQKEKKNTKGYFMPLFVMTSHVK